METSKIDRTIKYEPVRPPTGLARFGLFVRDLPGTVFAFLIYIVGAIPNAVAYVINGIYDFCTTYKREISIALWVGLGVAIAVAIAGLVMALWFPAALAAVTGVSVLGFSIAMIAGESAILQVLLGTALALVVADVAAVVLASVFIGIREACEWIKSGFSAEKTSNPESQFTSKAPSNTNLYAHDNMQTNGYSREYLEEPHHGTNPLNNKERSLVESFNNNDDYGLR